MGIIIIVAVIFLTFSGCDSMEPEWRLAPSTYACSIEQMERVKSEAIWCKENTDYLKEYCYGSAIMRNCDKKKEPL